MLRTLALWIDERLHVSKLGSWPLLVRCSDPSNASLATYLVKRKLREGSVFPPAERRMKLLTCLLPKRSTLHLETWQLDEATAQLMLRVTSRQPLGYCPGCRCPTRRIHSRYERTVAD